MFRLKKAIQEYPNKTVFADVISRSGPPDDKCFTPFNGLEGFVRDSLRGDQKSKFRREDCINYIAGNDYNPEATRTDDVTNAYGFIEVGQNNVFHTLEDVVDHQKYIKKYVGYMLYSYLNNGASPYKEVLAYEKSFKYDLDGDVASLREDLESTAPDSDYQMREQAIAEIPYLLKILDEFGRSWCVNMFSFVRVLEKILRHKPREFINANDFDVPGELIRIKHNGEFYRYFNFRKDQRDQDCFVPIRMFVSGQLSRFYDGNPQTTPVYKAMYRLMYDLKVLGIDIQREDPAQYSSEYIDNIVCTYIPTNTEYLDNFRDIDAEIMSAISPENIFSHILKDGSSIDSSGLTITDYLQCVDSCVSSYSNMIEGIDKSLDKMDKVCEFFSKLVYYTQLQNGENVDYVPDLITPDQFTSAHGFICYQGGGDNLVQWQSPVFPKYLGLFDVPVVFTTYGLVIPILDRFDKLWFMSIETAIYNIDRMLEGYQDAGLWLSL